MRLAKLLFLSSLLFQSLLAATLSPIEKGIQQYVNANKKEQLQLLEKLVNINSGTFNTQGVYQVGNILKKEFAAIGFTTQWVEEPANMHRAGALIATHKARNNRSSKRILLIGHLDTVFPKTSDFQYYKQIGNIARGPGVGDDKGGDIVILYALKALAAMNVLDEMNITVVLTGDEEDSGKPTAISRKSLIAVAKESDVALDFEIAFDLKTATIARRGVEQWVIQTEGKEGHSSDIFNAEAGDGAIFELSRILDNFRIQFARKKYLSCNPGLSLGGTTLQFDESSERGEVSGKQNVIAKVAVARGDFRFLTPEQKTWIEKKMRLIVNQHLLGTFSRVDFEEGIPAMPPTSNNLQLLNQYSQVSVDLGDGVVKPLDPGLRGAGDISHVAAIVPFNLAGLGPVGSGPHSNNENVDIRSFSVMTARTAILISRLSS